MAEVAAIVLAAGRGTRYGAASGDSKVLALFEGRSLVEHVVATALASGAAPVVAVVGQGAERLGAVLRQAGPITIVRNDDYASGMASSLRAGLSALPATAAGALVLLGDMPLVASATLDGLIARFLEGDVDAVAPMHAGQQGNPVLLGRSLFPALERVSGDQGARAVLNDPSCRLARLDVDDPGVLVDVDTPAGLAMLAAARR